MKTKALSRVAVSLLFPITMPALTGYWTPPNANVQPAGGMNDTVDSNAMAQSVDSGYRLLTLQCVTDKNNLGSDRKIFL